METVVLAVVPYGPVAGQLRVLMERYSAFLHSQDALKLPPHFTLVPRFKTGKYAELLRALRDVCARMKPLRAELDSLGHFERPPVLFFHVRHTPEIQQLHEQLMVVTQDFREPWSREELREYTSSPEQQELLRQYGSPFVKQFYSPHLTIAGSDVEPTKFQELISALPQERPITVTVDSIQILRKTPSGWVVDNSIPLGKSR